ncbi:type VI secretion system ATPase TssH [Zoogloea sp. LCSB751]|uniref:type VI secretion system ATPase TssH n=1 Tax=Zoogloea sp. LCSB751 TaxID=1965277 RepID=UPI0009A4F282|nr:type VI secretion system ATPase TssH [Zoogloea sp. LCSB751]
MTATLKVLIGKLNAPCRVAAERAASLCMSRGHHEVDIEHLFSALLEQPDADFSLILVRNGINTRDVEHELNREMERFRTGNSRTPVFSVRIPKLLEQAWLIASLDAKLQQIRSGHLLLALLTEPELEQIAARSISSLSRVRLDDLKHKFDELTRGSAEYGGACNAEPVSPQGDDSARAIPSAGDGTALGRFTTNLTQQAREGRVDPVIGREAEISQLIDILLRRRQNNPILTGEAGVGKTAVVEGLALRIAADDVPVPLRGVCVHVLDMGLLQAGASVKGEFENRLKGVIAEVRQSSAPIVLFIDEAHSLIGAGGQSGQNDAANLLKPALARGELRTIAATTWAEYKKYFEKDAALARRFQVVKVDEPVESIAAAMLRGMVPLMERHFGVRVLDEAVTEAVRLSQRYISGRQLPDKAVGVLDTACAKVALAHGATPLLIDQLQKEQERVEAELAAVLRESAALPRNAERITALESRVAALESELARLHARLAEERSLVERVLDMRARMEGRVVSRAQGAVADAREDGGPAFTADADRQALEEVLQRLHALQGDRPMVPVHVDRHVVAEVVSSWTGIPLGKMVGDEIKTILKLGHLLRERVVGQDHALEAISQRVRTSRAALENPDKPKGVFLFVGPSGVGKTETALALADILYGGERRLVTINMSEYQEAHTVSGLKGAPPGYVGYGEGGVLTEAVRRNPYCVVLLDEVEKAHPDVLELFFQVFDKGVLEDGEGREIDFRNTLIILTSNVGSGQIMQACLNQEPEALPSADALAETLRPVLCKSFKPAFLGRVKVVPYFPISDEVLVQIIRLKLERIRGRVAANHQASLLWDESVIDAILERCTEVDSGARNVDHILDGSLLPGIAEIVLARMADGDGVEHIHIDTSEQGHFQYSIA